MIEWKKYNRYNVNEGPKLDKLYLVNHDGGVTSGFLDQADNGRVNWLSYNSNYILAVSHYAELNLPLKEPK